MKLLGKLFLLFTLSTAVELYLLLLLARATSWWLTVALTIISGALGSYLARREGMRAISRFRAALRLEGEPTEAVLDGVMLLVAAAFLITPGVITDAAGLLLMLPAVRRPVGRYLKRKVEGYIGRQLREGKIQFFTGGMGGARQGPSFDTEGKVIDIKPER